MSTPVLVGAAAVSQREDDPRDAVEAVELMIRATRNAADDASAPGLLKKVAWIGTPGGNWSYTDPGRLVAQAIGAPGAHTVILEIGLSQQDLIARACDVIARGDADVALIVGGEARYREQQAGWQGIDAPETAQVGEPDERVYPDSAQGIAGLSELEIVRHMASPVAVYAMIEDAIRRSRNETVDEHRDHVADLWHRFALVAADNLAAWDRSAPSTATIRGSVDGNKMLAYPYTKLLASQWNVDQAAALLICSADVARGAGVPTEQWVFPWASVISNEAINVYRRPELHRSAGASLATQAIFEATGTSAGDLTHVDLYSCFPAAVQVLAAEAGIGLHPAPTVTGGMTFAGGPLNNYVLQATVRLVALLRDDPGSLGLSSSVSAFLHKTGFGLWSTTPPSSEFCSTDVTESARAAAPPRPSIEDYDGAAAVVAATVEYAGLEPRAVAVCELEDGSRTIASTTDVDTCAAVEQGALDTVRLSPGGHLSP